jgi:hypothetical protein
MAKKFVLPMVNLPCPIKFQLDHSKKWYKLVNAVNIGLKIPLAGVITVYRRAARVLINAV